MIDACDTRYPTRGAGVFVLSDHVRVRWHHRPKRQSGGGSRSRSRSRSNGCISADVRVLTPNGYRAIASITIGDSILSLGDKDSVLVPREVRAVISCAPQVVYKVSTTSGSFKATRGHSFLTRRGWVRTRALRADDVLLGEKGAGYRVIFVQLSPTLESVYNLRTEREHNFIVEGGVVAHNFSFLRRLRSIIDEFQHCWTWRRLRWLARRSTVTYDSESPESATFIDALRPTPP